MYRANIKVKAGNVFHKKNYIDIEQPTPQRNYSA